jgi:ankyrin repeat protein
VYSTLIYHSLLVLQDGYTPLHTAAENGHLEVVRQLLGAEAAVDTTNVVRATTCAALTWATAIGGCQLLCLQVEGSK